MKSERVRVVCVFDHVYLMDARPHFLFIYIAVDLTSGRLTSFEAKEICSKQIAKQITPSGLYKRNGKGCTERASERKSLCW